MGWSWRIGRIAGIDVYVHLTFLVLLAWMGLANYLAGGIEAAIRGLGLILTLFGIVVLHELGHSLAARRFGIETRDITLLPIGGVARLERMPEEPSQELVVALAGPAVNVALAGGVFLLSFGRDVLSVGESFSGLGSFISQIFWVNIGLAVFNLLPAFPMDGGRVLRALLAMRMDYVRATQIAAGIGQGMAWLFGLLGLLFNPFLVFIALFVWIGAAQEASMVQMRAALDGIPVRNAMITDFRTLELDDPLSRAVEHILAGFQQDFPVLENGRPVGVLTRNDLAAGLAQRGPDARVGDVMHRGCATTDPREMLQVAFARLQDQDCHVLPVVQDGRLLGLLTGDNVAEVLMIKEALRTAQRASQWANRAG